MMALSRWCSWILIIVCCGMFWGCEPSESSEFTVVCTTGIIADVVQEVVSGNVRVISLMGPGVDPHLYQVTEGDIRRLATADIIFYNGLHLESKMTDLLAKLGKKKPVFAVADGVSKTLLRYDAQFGKYPDPHIWFDVSIWQHVAHYVATVMGKIDPDRQSDYDRNGQVYIQKLVELEAYVKKRAVEVPSSKRVLVTAHDAFGYFADAYGFEVRALQGMSTESEAGVKDVRILSDYLVERQLPVVFAESSVPRRYMDALIEATSAKGWDVQFGGELYSDALGTANTPAGTYLGMVKHNVDHIVEGLSRP